MMLRRRIGVSLIAVGGMLLGMYVVPTLYGAAMARAGVAQFRAARSSTILWNKSRLQAHQHALRLRFAAPEAVLSVPRLGIEVPVLEGTDALTLNRGVGHLPGTALPGEPGNVVIAGHRDGFFRALKDTSVGDVIEVQGHTSTQRYVVRRISIVFPHDTSVLKATTDSNLTLVTCYPFYFVGAAPQRYIVQASLLPASNSSGD